MKCWPRRTTLRKSRSDIYPGSSTPAAIPHDIVGRCMNSSSSRRLRLGDGYDQDPPSCSRSRTMDPKTTSRRQMRGCPAVGALVAVYPICAATSMPKVMDRIWKSGISKPRNRDQTCRRMCRPALAARLASLRRSGKTRRAHPGVDNPEPAEHNEGSRNLESRNRIVLAQSDSDGRPCPLRHEECRHLPTFLRRFGRTSQVVIELNDGG